MSLIKQILWHLAAICSLIIIESYTVLLSKTNASLTDFATFYALHIIFFYLTSGFVLPKTTTFLQSRLLRIISLLVHISVFALLNLLITILLYRHHDVPFLQSAYWPTFIRAFVRQFYIFALALGYWYARRQIKLERERSATEIALAKKKEETAKLELALIRTQMNPHLMVNALSGVQGILLEKAPETVRIIYSLMDIQASVLKMSDPAFENTLGNELKVVNYVVELFSNLGKTNLKLSVSVDENLKATPFPAHVLITLIENIFKHADFTAKEIPPIVLVESDEARIHILVQNKIAPSIRIQEWERIGTSSVHQALENTFSDRYRWKESITDNFYELDIKIFR
ncbi:MAG: histidine kinase [Sphingobacterium sp.]|jgi:sensor histidine kinase YesM|uniref:histidine kinase n=1 Tax=Sphingobacterium sp. TaxID=341027 RepID=UPI00284CC425|nr:histidine kinase [Sphingobacterium sp.]MDR3008613.1 histidine kinase [Sphingobacterium sp.]